MVWNWGQGRVPQSWTSDRSNKGNLAQTSNQGPRGWWMGPPFSFQSTNLGRDPPLPAPDMTDHLVGPPAGLGQHQSGPLCNLPSPPCPAPQLPRMVPLSVSCGPFGNSHVPRLCSEPKAGPLPHGNTTVVSAELPAVFPSALSPFFHHPGSQHCLFSSCSQKITAYRCCSG